MCVHHVGLQVQGTGCQVTVAMDPNYPLLYGGDNSGKVFCINSTDGTLVWTYNAVSASDTTIFIAGGRRLQYANGLLLFLCGSRLVALTTGPTVGTAKP